MHRGMFRPQSFDMIKKVLLLPWFLFLFHCAFTQNPLLQDSTLNNLVHPAGYKTCTIGDLGNVKKTGKGKQSMIIIPGLGFGGDKYDELVRHYKKRYTVYTITPAGFDGTPAPPMPEAPVKYFSLPWTNGIEMGIINLIEKENLYKPIILAHFVTGTQVALNLAHDHPDLISSAIIIGGSPYRYHPSQKKDGSWSDWENEQKYTPDQREKVLDYYWAPKWFKTVTKKTWDDNMWTPDDYCKDKTTGKDLFDSSARVPIQVMVEYLLEWMAYDPQEKYKDIHVPVLVLVPDFKELLSYTPKDTLSCKSYAAKQYLKYFHQVSWQDAIDHGIDNFTFKTISDSRLFTWIDNPDGTYASIDDFIKSKSKMVKSNHLK